MTDPSYQAIADNIKSTVDVGAMPETARRVQIMTDLARHQLYSAACEHGGYYLVAAYTMALLELNKVWNAATPEQQHLIATMVDAVYVNFKQRLQ